MPFFRAKRSSNLNVHRVERVVALRFTSTDRIAAGIAPTIQKLLADSSYGEAYRCAVAHFHRTEEPPLAYYLGRASLCRIDGPFQEASSDRPFSGYLPAGGLIEAAGHTIRLSPVEANAIHHRIQSAIEQEIAVWVREREEHGQRELREITNEAITALDRSVHDV